MIRDKKELGCKVIKKTIVILMLTTMVCLTGCQSAARRLGGDITLELDAGLKLEEITWKEDSLWYLTRPMRDDENPETHVFKQSSDFGIMEGSVTVIEKAKEVE